METFTVREASAALGMSVDAVHKALSRGEMSRVPGSAVISLSAASVTAFQRSRRDTVLSRHDAEELARRVVEQLRPAPTPSVQTYDGRTVYVPVLSADGGVLVAHEGGRKALGGVPLEAVAAFGPAVLDAAAVHGEPGACRTCFARLTARVHGSLPPRDDAATKILLGQPCSADRAAWRAHNDAQTQLQRRAKAAVRKQHQDEQAARVRRAARTLQEEQVKAARLGIASPGAFSAAPGGRVALTAGGAGAPRGAARPDAATCSCGCGRTDADAGLSATELSTKRRNFQAAMRRGL